MQIKKIKLTNIRCFKNFEVDLTSANGTKKWMVILGENGVGKTTLLRSIALGLCEKAGAAGLCSEVPGNWIRNGAEIGVIRIDIEPYPSYKGEAYVETRLLKGEYGEVNLEQDTFPKTPGDFKWERLFVCGYGSARSIYGSMDVSEYAVTDSVYSLFNYDSDLQNPELSLRRIADDKKDQDAIIRKLEAVLMIPEKSIELTKSGIVVNGPWGKPMPIGTLGDGYKSTITWLLDLYGWKLLAEEYGSGFEMEGVVILDEMEKHLHPRWQKQLVKLFSTQFPKIQFITSTHSPLCVLGTTDLEDDNCSISVLKQQSDEVIADLAFPPRRKRVDQVLTSYLFELLSASDDAIKESIQRYLVLFNTNTRTSEDEEELKVLKATLEKELGGPESEIEKKVRDAVNATLASLADDASQKISEDSPYSLEVKRQLKNLFKKEND
jgi:energy-coupling factor transporter ATP-binding protein EcfA2